VSKTTKTKTACTATIARIDTQNTAFQPKIAAEVLEHFNRITLPILQHLVKLSGGETNGLLVPLEWDKGYEEFFQLLMELIQSPLHPLVEEGLQGLAKVLNVVDETLSANGLDWGASERCECVDEAIDGEEGSEFQMTQVLER